MYSGNEWSMYETKVNNPDVQGLNVLTYEVR